MEINGLPLHPLVVHAAVVFAPLAALVALVYAVRPAWRTRLLLPMVGLAVVAGLSVVAAYLSGGSFLESRPELRAVDLVDTHEERAGVLLWVAIAQSVAALGTAWLREREGAVRVVSNVALGLLSVAVVVLVVLVGDSGARAVWG